MAELKTKQTGEDVSKFLDTIADESKRKDCYTITKLMEKVTGEKAAMWGSAIVGCGKYHYKYESGHEGDSVLIGFSPRKQNITIYVMLGLVMSKYPDLENLLKSLGKFKTGKGCLYISKLEDIDIERLEELMAITVKSVRIKYPGN